VLLLLVATANFHPSHLQQLANKKRNQGETAESTCHARVDLLQLITVAQARFRFHWPVCSTPPRAQEGKKKITTSLLPHTVVRVAQVAKPTSRGPEQQPFYRPASASAATTFFSTYNRRQTSRAFRLPCSLPSSYF
jgi:hypothetical protein